MPQPRGEFSDRHAFAAHVALLDQFLARRPDIVQRLEHSLLNVRGKAIAQSRDRRQFEGLLDACFFEAPGLPREAAALKGQLAAAHRARGFEPVPLGRYTQEFDPVELVPRAYMHWDAHRWPGSSGRETYARTLFSAFVTRQIELLSLRCWEEGTEHAEDRLHELQRVLDSLNATTGSAIFIRDARWLIQTAQGPLTRHLLPYFEISEGLAQAFTAETRVAVHQAGVRLAGGHLRSQIRYRVWNTGRPMDDPELLAFTRLSNSMDTALLVGDLVALLEAYGSARERADVDERLALADGILQGLSADPQLLLTRLDLLAPCTIVEELFLTTDHGPPAYTPRGVRHLAVLERYAGLIARHAASLIEDAAHVDPSREAYSPLGITYGFCADLFNNVAASALVGAPRGQVVPSIEDLFTARVAGTDADILALAERWRSLPTAAGERAHFEHSVEWAGGVFAALMRALHTRARRPATANASATPDAGIAIVSGSPNAQQHCFTSDVARAVATGAIPHAAAEIASHRSEGRYLASAETGGEWFGVSKLLVTLLLAQGEEARLIELPPLVVDRLRLTCPGIRVRVIAPEADPS